jgi:hypothetical protein
MAVRYWFGSVLVLAGLGLLADQMFPALEVGVWLGRLWPLAIILLGVLLLLTKSSSWIGAMIILVFGAILQIAALGFLSENIWGLLWPSFLILLGVLVIVRLGRPGVVGGKTEDAINLFTAFSGYETRPQSANFRGGSATVAFGGTDIDLRDAKLAKEGAFLELTAAFGGMDIIIPKDWAVDINGLPLFGGWSNKTSPTPVAGSPVLTIRCLAMFGAIEIKN